MNLRLLLVGFGTVGQGLAELLMAKEEELAERFGFRPVVVGISDRFKGSLYDPDGLELQAVLRQATASGRVEGAGPGFAGDALDLVSAAEADMLVEATPTDLVTGEPATSHIRRALEKGLHVTTTNKGPVALHLQELEALAARHLVRFLYEGTVLSGTPLLNLLREGLTAATISEIRGILNGTTNYVLGRMEAGSTYAEALAEAQKLGYAETDPEADVSGRDVLAKITILAQVAFGAPVRPGDFPCEGITAVTPDDLAGAARRGQRVKLLGRLRRESGTLRGSVAPEAIDLADPLAGVSGPTNAVTLHTDVLGPVTIVGPGAGREPTGYSALIDIIHVGRRA